MHNPFSKTRQWRHGVMILSAVLAATTALGSCGCTTSLPEWFHNGLKVGPNYTPPPVPPLDGWIDQKDPKVHVGDPNLACWWDVFGDPILTKLLHDSYANNLTIRAAGMQIQAAQMQRLIALGELLPQSQNVALSYSRTQLSANGGNLAAVGQFFSTSLAPPATLTPVTTPNTPIAGVVDPGNGSSNSSTNLGGPGTLGVGVGGGSSRFFSNLALSANMAWEIDFWGAFRRNLEAASAILDQSVENYDEMLVLLLANVASKYVEIRTLQRRLELARHNVALQEPLVSVAEKLYKQGIANSLVGYYQLKSNLDATKALIPQLEISLRQANNQLCTLLGIPVRDLLPELGDGTVPDPSNPGKRYVRIPRPMDLSVVVGIPGDLLLRRPDVRSAEDQLRVQSAEIGIAEAEMYPHIGINGSIGLAADRLSHLFDPRSGVGTIGPSLSWNIFNYGRLLANVRLQNLTYQQLVDTYQQAILNANQDAENALVGYLRTIEQARNLKDSADAAERVTDYLFLPRAVGGLPGMPAANSTLAFYNQLFTVINFQVTQQDAAAQAEGNIALNLILLYRAMGGGWQIRLQHEIGPDGSPCAMAAEQPTPVEPAELLPAPKPLPVEEPKTPPAPAEKPEEPAKS